MIPKVIFEDSSLLILDKPPGLVVDKSESQKTDTLEDWLPNNGLDRGGIVHRLDKDTSGLMLVAKTKEALENLQAQFKDRLVKKQYLALVHGHIADSGRVEASIGRNPRNREKFSVLSDGKEAVTEYEPVENLQFTIYNLQKVFSDFNKIQMRKLERQGYGQFTLLRCFPKTGRTHQIRVHLKYTGHPIVADGTYAGRKMYRLDHRWCPRQFLHAAKLEFRHPVSAEWMEFESSVPEDLEKALENLHE